MIILILTSTAAEIASADATALQEIAHDLEAIKYVLIVAGGMTVGWLISKLIF